MRKTENADDGNQQKHWQFRAGQIYLTPALAMGSGGEYSRTPDFKSNKNPILRGLLFEEMLSQRVRGSWGTLRDAVPTLLTGNAVLPMRYCAA